MSGPLTDPEASLLKQTTTTARSALDVLRRSFPGNILAESSGVNSLAVPLPRKLRPTYVLPNNRPQPWELLPVKAAALQRYPNFFNAACMFFGSLKRDVVLRLPRCIVPTTKIGLELAKVLRNLGVVSSFELVQKRRLLRDDDYVWPRGHEPVDLWDTKLFKHKHLRLDLRWNIHEPIWQVGSVAKASPHTGSGSSSSGGRGGAGDPLTMPGIVSAGIQGPIPLSVKNVSKASQPVFMYPSQLEQARRNYPCGLFVCFHHEYGIITDGQAELYDVPVLVLAHLGLPFSQAAQIRGALRYKHKAEAGLSPDKVTPLQAWSLADFLRESLERRNAALAKTINVEQQAAAVLAAGRQLTEQARSELQQYDTSAELQKDLVAWEMVQTGTAESIPKSMVDNYARLMDHQRRRRERQAAAWRDIKAGSPPRGGRPGTG